MNPYEAGTQKVIPATLLYAFFQSSVLMIQKNDHWNGLGGKLDLGESPLDSAVREFHEEAGLLTEARDWKWSGQLFFPNFKPKKQQDWWVTVYRIDLNAIQAAQIKTQVATPEGTLHWVPESKLMTLPLWDGDADFLPHVVSATPFEGTLFYQEGRCVRKSVQTLATPH